MFSQDDRTDGILQTTHSTPHEAGGRPSPLRAAAAAPRPRAAAACPAPGHGDTGGDPMEPCWGRGWCHPHPTDQPQPAPDPLWSAQQVSWPDGQTDLAGAPATVSPEPSATPWRAGPGPEECLGSAAKGQPSGWHGFFCPGCLALINHFKSRSFCKCFSSIKAAVSGLRQKCWCFIGSGEHQHRITAEALILLGLHWMD